MRCRSGHEEAVRLGIGEGARSVRREIVIIVERVGFLCTARAQIARDPGIGHIQLDRDVDPAVFGSLHRREVDIVPHAYRGIAQIRQNAGGVELVGLL